MSSSALKLHSRPLPLKAGKLSVIVPVFNEYPNIVRNLNMLMDEVANHFSDFEIIVVSDGSTDGTDDKIKTFRHPNFTPIVYERNQGKGNAVRSGFKRATGDFILFVDGGMEIHPKEIRIFVGLMDLYECDIVVGSKRHPQSKVIYPWYRKILSWIYQLMTRALFNINVTDTQVGIKLFSRAVIDAILPNLEVDRYGFDLEILSLAQRAGFNEILEAPIRLDYFGRNQRFIVSDLLHVLRVGMSLMKDTLKLYLRLRKIPKK